MKLIIVKLFIKTYLRARDKRYDFFFNYYHYYQSNPALFTVYKDVSLYVFETSKFEKNSCLISYDPTFLYINQLYMLEYTSGLSSIPIRTGLYV